MAKYYDIHVFINRKNGYSIPFKTNAEGEEEILAAAVKAGKLDEGEATQVDSIDEIWDSEYKTMEGNEEEDDAAIEQEEIELSKTMDKTRDENF